MPSAVLPVITYYNPDQKKKNADNKERSGIYLWENKISGKTYVGSSQDLRKRIVDYFDNNNLKNPKGSIIYKTLSKYGHNNFNLNILEYCSIKDLMVREQYYLDTLKPDYNILNFAGSSGGYRHSEASK